MADPLRSDTGNPNDPLRSSVLQDPSVEPLLQPPDTTRELPPLENPRLNRTAETIGTALGSTVGKLRSGISLVQSRTGETTRGMTDTLSEKAQEVSAAALEQAEHLGDVAEEKLSQVLDGASEQWDNTRRFAREAVIEARRQAAKARQEHPIEVILGFGALSLAVGFALRVWRSSND